MSSDGIGPPRKFPVYAPVMPKTFREMQELAKRYDAERQAGDFPEEVLVAHDDGSLFCFTHAKALIYQDTYLLVFTEHNGYHVFCLEDLRKYAAEKRAKSDKVYYLHRRLWDTARESTAIWWHKVERVDELPSPSFEVSIQFRKVTVTKRSLTYEEVIELCGDPHFSPKYNTTVVYRQAYGDKPEGSLCRGQSVEVTNGTSFQLANTGSA